MTGDGARHSREPSTTRSKHSRQSSLRRNGQVEALDFDSHRKIRDGSLHAPGVDSPISSLRDDESLLENVVDGIIREDRDEMKAQVQKYLSYGSAILSW